MARPTTKRAKTKAPKDHSPDEQGFEMEDAPPQTATAVAEPPRAEPPRAESSTGLQPPSTPVELAEETKTPRAPLQKDQIASSINIAKLQAMSMTALNN